MVANSLETISEAEKETLGMTSLKEKYIATMIGEGCGDELGMVVEGWKREQIIKYVGKITAPIAPILVKDKEGKLIEEDEFGKLKHWAKDSEKGDVSDDTILTLAIAESIGERKGLDLEHITQKQIQAYQSCKQPDGSLRGGFGGSTITAFERIISGVPILEAGSEPGLGTGPCMKMPSLGLYIDASGYLFEVIDMARKIGLSTHKDERAITAGMAQASAIYALLKGGLNRNMFLDAIWLMSKFYERPFNPKFSPEKGTLTDRLKWVKENKDVNDEKAHEYLKSSSNVLDSYPFTIFMFQKYFDDPINGLIETVNWGGDCDTTGAMFGALAGARHGMVFPKEWVDVLKYKDKLQKAAEGIYAIKENGK
jgi:poly(ADP-ribose) glycohydrolase ARH3